MVAFVSLLLFSFMSVRRRSGCLCCASFWGSLPQLHGSVVSLHEGEGREEGTFVKYVIGPVSDSSWSTGRSCMGSGHIEKPKIILCRDGEAEDYPLQRRRSLEGVSSFGISLWMNRHGSFGIKIRNDNRLLNFEATADMKFHLSN
ncbi:hypothetical protein BJX62DRAFT_189112 [Aspergillus germanicus]